MNINTFTNILKKNGCETIYKATYPDVVFLLVENKNKAVLIVTIPLKGLEYKGIKLSSPIVPNIYTGSSVIVTDPDQYINESEAFEIITKWTEQYPNFFSREQRENTKFETIEQASKRLDYKLIK